SCNLRVNFGKDRFHRHTKSINESPWLTDEKRGTYIRAIRGYLLRVTDALILVCLLQNRECLLFLALIRNKSFAIEFILDASERPIWRTEIHQQPRAHSSQLRNLVQ